MLLGSSELPHGRPHVAAGQGAIELSGGGAFSGRADPLPGVLPELPEGFPVCRIVLPYLLFAFLGWIFTHLTSFSK